jgi:ankyrin repeat protein
MNHTPLLVAALKGNMDVIHCLLDAGANIDAKAVQVRKRLLRLLPCIASSYEAV